MWWPGNRAHGAEMPIRAAHGRWCGQYAGGCDVVAFVMFTFEARQAMRYGPERLEGMGGGACGIRNLALSPPGGEWARTKANSLDWPGLLTPAWRSGNWAYI